MAENDIDRKSSPRGCAVLYSLGWMALILMAVITLADIVRVYFAFGTEFAVGMMIPRMGVFLGYTGSGVQGVLCSVVAYVWLAAIILSAVLSGRWFACSIVSLVLFSLDTIVSLWFFLATYSIGFLPSLLLHIAFEILLIIAVVFGRRLKCTESGVRGALRLTFGRAGK